MGSVGQVTVEVVPDADGFQRSLRSQLPLSSLDRLGEDMGKRVAKSYGRSFGRAVGGSIRGASASMASAVASSSGAVSRSATTVGRTAGKSMQTGMAKYGLSNWTGTPAGQRMAQRFGTQLGSGAAPYVSSSLSTGLGKYGIRGNIANTPFGRSLTKGVSTSVQTGVSSGVSRHHNGGQVGSAAAFMLPQVGTGPLSGMLAMTATTPKMLALAGGVAAVGTALYGAVTAAQVAGAGMQAYGNLAQYALNQAGQLENTKVALNTLMGSEAKAQEMLDKSIEFAKTTPFDLPSVTDGVKQLKAYGFANKELLPVLTDIGDASASLGLGAPGIQRMVMAFGQIKARGTFRADEARQLTEAGIPAWRSLAEAMSEVEGKDVSIQEVMRRAEAGTIKAGFALKALRATMQETFGGGMEAQSQTFLGTLEKLKDSANIGLQVAMQPALKSLAGTISQVLPQIEDLSYVLGANLGSGIEGFAKTVTAGLAPNLAKISDAFGPLLAKLGPRFGAIIDDLATAFANFSPAISDIVDGFYNATKAFTGFFELLSGAAPLLDGVTSAFKNFGDVQRALSDGLGSLFGNGDEIATERLSEAQAQVSGIGRELASSIERANPNLPKFNPEIDMEGLERGSGAAVERAISFLEGNRAQADILDIDPDAFRQRLRDATTNVEGVIDGEQVVSVEARVGTAKAEADLLSLAAKVANVGKGMSFGIDSASLQDISTALPELQQLSELGNKNLRTVLGVDASQVPAARAQIESLISTLQYASAMQVNPTVGTQKIQYGMQRAIAVFDSWIARASTKDILVGAKIKPGDLQNFSPEAIQRLLGPSGRKILLDLGVKPGQVAGFQGQLQALLSSGAGTQITVPVKPKIQSGPLGLAGSVNAAAGGVRTVEIPVKYGEPPAMPNLPDPDPVKASIELDTAAFSAAVAASGEAGAQTGEAYVSSLQLFQEPAASAGNEIGTGSANGMAEGGAGASGAGQSAGAGFVSGLSGYRDAAYAAGAELGAAATQGMKDNLDVNSPSRVTMGIGRGVGEGFIIGMRSAEDRVEAAGQVLAQKVTKPFGPKVNKQFKRFLKQSDKFQKQAIGNNIYFKSFTSDPSNVLDGKQSLLDQKLVQLGDSAWAIERAQKTISDLSTKLDDRQDRLDRAVDKNKNGKPNAKQKVEQKAIDARRRYLELRGRELDEEAWQNRKQERVNEQAQRGIDARRRILEQLAQFNEAKWEFEDTLADSQKDGTSDGILASVTDLERRLARSQIPDTARSLAEATIRELKKLAESKKLQEQFDSIKDALRPATLRDLAPDGVKEWAQGVRDAIEDSDIGFAMQWKLGEVLNGQLAAVNAYADQLKRIESARQLKQTLIDAVGGSIDWNKSANPASLSRALRKRTTQMTQYAAQLTQLRQAGLSDKAIQRIAAMDPAQAAKFTARLVAGGSSAINDFNNAIAGFEQSVETVGDSGAAAAWAESGAQAALGFVAGMESQESVIRAALKALAQGMLADWKKELGIASPSKVFAEAAAWIPLGMAQGIDSERAAVQASVKRLVSVPKMPKLATAPGQVGLVAAGGNDIKIDVHPREHMDERQTARMVARELLWRV